MNNYIDIQMQSIRNYINDNIKNSKLRKYCSFKFDPYSSPNIELAPNDYYISSKGVNGYASPYHFLMIENCKKRYIYGENMYCGLLVNSFNKKTILNKIIKYENKILNQITHEFMRNNVFCTNMKAMGTQWLDFIFLPEGEILKQLPIKTKHLGIYYGLNFVFYVEKGEMR